MYTLYMMKMTETERIKNSLIERGTTESYAKALVAEVTGPTTTTKECIVVISAIDEIQHRAGLSEVLWTLKDDTERKRKAFSDAAFRVACSASKSSPKGPNSQYWDDDAPGGVIYE